MNNRFIRLHCTERDLNESFLHIVTSAFFPKHFSHQALGQDFRKRHHGNSTLTKCECFCCKTIDVNSILHIQKSITFWFCKMLHNVSSFLVSQFEINYRKIAFKWGPNFFQKRSQQQNPLCRSIVLLSHHLTVDKIPINLQTIVVIIFPNNSAQISNVANRQEFRLLYILFVYVFFFQNRRSR